MPTRSGHKVYAYAIHSRTQTIPEQFELLRQYARNAKALGVLGIDHEVMDAEYSQVILQVDERIGGSWMMDRLRRGDQVIVPKMYHLVSSVSRSVRILDRFANLGVGLHVLQLHGLVLDLSSPIGRLVIEVAKGLVDSEQEYRLARGHILGARSERMVASGEQVAVNAWTRVGFKAVPMKVGGKVVKKSSTGPVLTQESDPEQRRVMSLIVNLKDGPPPMDWYGVIETLNRDGILRPNNKSFSDAIIRAIDSKRTRAKHWNLDVTKAWYRAEKKLRRLEAEELQRKEGYHV